MSFFSQQEPDRVRAPSDTEGGEREDEQQALLLNALRRAAGEPVSYAELRDAGIEFPAGIVSELELEGVPLERCRVGPRRGPGVRLEPTRDVPTGGTTSEWTDVRVYRASSGGAFVLAAIGSLPRKARSTPRTRRRPATRSGTGRAVPRLVVLLLLAAAIGLVTALVLIESGGGSRSTGGSAAHLPRAPAGAASSTSTSAKSAGAATRRRPAGRTPPTPVSPALASRLAARGHGLMEAGRYGDAVPVLHRAVRATGKSLASCAEPASSICLTYAFALYDLGRALRLSGHPAAAVPVLKRRLRIDNQRPAVQAELRLADRGIG